MLAWVASWLIRSHPPEPESRTPDKPLPVVDITTLAPVDFPVVIEARGLVEPTLSTALVPEVAGTIVELSDAFVVGGSFEENELLVRIDDQDYRIALTQARASVAQSRAQLLEQQALAEQAVNEWRALSRPGEPSSLTLREPQVAAAEANLEAAQAQLQRAQLDLERTRLRAPYTGRVLERRIELGEFVNRGVAVGRVHSANSLNVRLPLGGSQLDWLVLPEPGTSIDDSSRVQVRGRLAATGGLWEGRLVRAEGLDAATQQLDVIARIQSQGLSLEALRPGQFVDALIEGALLESVFVIPRVAVREQSHVLILDQDDTVRRRSIDIVWADDQNVVVADGVQAGERLVLTRLSVVADGTPVRPSIEADAEPISQQNEAADTKPSGRSSLTTESGAPGARDDG